MTKLIGGVLLALPFSVGAETIYVEYQGTVASVADQCWVEPLSIKVGDPIKGLLKIDTGLAPPDLAPADRTEGLYTLAGATYNPVDFVTSRNSLFGTAVLRGDDGVDIVDNRAGAAFPGRPLFDGFLARDSNFHNPDSPSDVINVAVTMSSADTDLISGDGLVQSFVAEPESLVTSISGAVERIAGEFRYYVGFFVDRLTVTPGRCYSGA